jgi:hypothetical protein
MASAYSKVERYKTMVSILLEEYEVKCYFCGEQLTANSLYRNKSGKSMDDLCWHHLNGKHWDNIKGNKRFAHRKCHLKYHRTKEREESQLTMNEVKRNGIK